jgi:hypothetical protein
MQLFAYLDPGAGSLVIQALIAGLIGAGFYFRQLVVAPIQAVWRRFSRPSNEESRSGSPASL